MKLSSNSKLENQFLSLWLSLAPDLPLIQEFRFSNRRFRADFAHLPSSTLIDIQGGIWLRGNSGHSSGKGISRDNEKLLIAQINGYCLFYLNAEMIDKKHLSLIIAHVKSFL